jgi:hypothetical protein
MVVQTVRVLKSLVDKENDEVIQQFILLNSSVYRHIAMHLRRFTFTCYSIIFNTFIDIPFEVLALY